MACNCNALVYHGDGGVRPAICSIRNERSAKTVRFRDESLKARSLHCSSAFLEEEGGMARVARKNCETEIYHLTGRGVGRQIIFEDDRDREAFLDRLIKHLSLKDIDILAWCLMGNHFHLLVKGAMETLSSSMRSLLSSYALYFNVRHDRHGHLFQDRFASQCVKDDVQLLATARYIHLNPVKAGLTQSPHYQWSSYEQYAGSLDDGICNTELIIDIVGDVAAFLLLHRTDPHDEGLLEDNPYRKRWSDDQAALFMKKQIGRDDIQALPFLEPKERDMHLAAARRAGLSIRQLQRLTGIGYRIVAEAGKGQGLTPPSP